METRARYILIGAFTILGFLAMGAFLLWFGASQANRQFAQYDVLFDNVSGISRGSAVNYAGLAVGQVSTLSIDRGGSGKVRVRLEIAAATPVRTGSVATLEAQGVTGVAVVAISPGDPDQPLLADTVEGIPVIPAGRSTLQSLTESAPAVLDEALAAITHINEILTPETQQSVTNIIANLDSASARLDSTLGAADEALTGISGGVEALNGLAATVNELSGKAESVLDAANGAIADFTGLKGQASDVLDAGARVLSAAEAAISTDLKAALEDLRATSGRLRQAADELAPDARDLVATWTDTGTQASARLDEAEALIASIKASADALDAETMGKLNAALDQVATDLPQLTGDLREAGAKASEAFGALREMIARADTPLNDFFRTSLPEFGRLATDTRRLVGTLDSLASRLSRSPARTLLNTDKPEFRR